MIFKVYVMFFFLARKTSNRYCVLFPPWINFDTLYSFSVGVDRVQGRTRRARGFAARALATVAHVCFMILYDNIVTLLNGHGMRSAVVNPCSPTEVFWPPRTLSDNGPKRPGYSFLFEANACYGVKVQFLTTAQLWPF